jgi:ATP-dependent Zn protease
MEVRRLVNDAYDRARDLIAENIDRVHAVARKLLEVETLVRQEFELVMAQVGGGPVPAGAVAYRCGTWPFIQPP